MPLLKAPKISRLLGGLGLLGGGRRLGGGGGLLLGRGISLAASSGGLGLGRGPQGLRAVSRRHTRARVKNRRTRLSRSSCMISVESL